MEYFGVLALILMLGYSNYPKKVDKLEKEFRKIKSNGKGEKNMSKLISDLKGQNCTIECKEGLLDGKTKIECKVIDVDDEWIKISFINKKGENKQKVIRVDTVGSIELS